MNTEHLSEQQIIRRDKLKELNEFARAKGTTRTAVLQLAVDKVLREGL